MRLKLRVRASLILFGALLAIPTLLTSSTASAFTGHGAGTSGSPYRIATCTQLSEINDNLGAYYVLVANINCTGSTFTYIGPGHFTGTLDGKNHKISNLNINDKGLFYWADGATIKNISITSGSVTGGYVGSFASISYDTTYTNIHSAMTVTSSSGAYSGGLVGDMNNNDAISKSSFTGTINTSSSYTGGLVGDLWSAGTSITDSFSSGTFNSNASYAGGIAGANFSGTINRVYSNMTFNANSSQYNGGIVGLNQTAVSNSFSAVARTGGSSYGGLIGSNSSGTYTNNYFDITSNGTSTCGAGSGCTGVNSGNSTPNYFKNNSTNAPLNAWDFTNVWQTTTDYPTLRGIAAFESPTVPNLGDANGDSTDDAFQPYVGSISDTNGVFSTVTVPSAGGCTLDTPESTTTSSLATDTGFSPIINLTGFTLYCPTAGATVPVTIIYDKVYDTSKAVLRHYNPTTHVYSTVAGATFGTTTIGGVQKTTVTYNLTDGGPYDTDGTANGAIVDPVGISNTPDVPNTGFAPQQPNIVENLLTIALISASAFAIAAARHSYNS